MVRFSVSSSITVGVFTEVLASSPEEAKEIAFTRQVTALSQNAQMESASGAWRLSDGLASDVCPFNVEVVNLETGDTVELDSA